MDIHKFRKWHMTIAEMIDAWRLIPRVLMASYSYLLYLVIKWYMELKPEILDKCVSDNITDCIMMAPTTQHAALVTAVVGISAAIFALYSNSGRKWENAPPPVHDVKPPVSETPPDDYMD